MVLLAFLLAAPAAMATYRVELNAPKPLKELLSAHLDLMRYKDREDINADQLNFMIATAADQVSKLASTEGYFSTETAVDVSRGNGATTVRLDVTAGPRTTVSEIDLDVAGAVTERSPAQAAEVRDSWPLKTGEPFRQADWSDAKQSGLQVLQQRRYAAARIDTSEARVLADRHEAKLDVRYDSGPLFTLGEAHITGTQRYPQRIIENVNPLQPGEEFSSDRLLEFQRQILRTPYYSNAVVDIDRDPAHAERAPVKVEVTEYPLQQIRGGVGYTSDTGARLEGRYSHNSFLRDAWVLDTRAQLEQRRQFADVELAMPPRPGGFVHSVHGSLDRTTLEGIDLRSRRLGVRRARTSDARDTAYFVEYYRDTLQQLDGAELPADTLIEPGAHQAVMFGIEQTRRQVDSLVFPRDGVVVELQAGMAVQGIATDQTFARGYGRIRKFVPLFTRDLVIFRAELGAVVTKGGNAAIPASLLFRAGGTESVRGYGFQSIGNERDGRIYPARYLATGSAEYQHWISDSWGGAVFYDVGMATDRWSDRSLFNAVGAGARWKSPVGRLRVDIAYGIQDKKLRPHVSLGVAF